MTDLTTHKVTLLPCMPAMPVHRVPHDELMGGLGDIVMPVIVNAYDLVPTTPFHGPGGAVIDRLFRDLLPLVRKIVTPDTTHIRTVLAAWESIHACGATTFANMYRLRPNWARSSTPQTNTGRKILHE